MLPEWKGFPLRANSRRSPACRWRSTASGGRSRRPRRGAGEVLGLRDFAALLVGDSVDGGVVSAGRLLDGRTGNVGQFGHIVVEPEGRSCSCGGVGCLDAYVSARAIESETNRPLRRTPPAVVDTTGILLARAVASRGRDRRHHTCVRRRIGPAALGQPLFDAMARELTVRSRLPHLAGLVGDPAPGRRRRPLVAAAAIARSTHR